MKSFLIDPFTRTVSLVTGSSDPAIVREMLGCTTFAVEKLDEDNHIVVGLNQEEKPGMRWWAFLNAQVPVAGKALVRGNSRDGMKALDTSVDHLILESRVQFPEIEFDGWVTLPKFRPLAGAGAAPAAPALPAQEQPQATPAGKPWTLWSITEDVDVGYRAAMVAVDEQGNAKSTGKILENDDLDELRAMLPPGLTKIERTATDHPSIVESWMSQPSQH